MTAINIRTVDTMPRGCAAKGCDNKGDIFLKLAILSLAGYFCTGCAKELQQDGLVEKVIHE